MLLIVGFCFLLTDMRPCMAGATDQKVEALSRRAKAYMKKGDYIYALKCYDNAIHLEPSNLGLYYGRAFALGRAGNYMAAINDFTLVIKKDEMHAKKNKTTTNFCHAPRFRADCYMALGCMQKAVKDYIKFLKSNKDSKVCSYLAEAFSLMGRNDLALKAIQKGLSTPSGWTGKLRAMQQRILTGKKITPHEPLSN